MIVIKSLLVVSVMLIGGGALAGVAQAAPRRDNEPDLQRRLQRETKPVKKAKLEIRLARLKLLEALAAFNQGNPDQGGELLRTYLTHARTAWHWLQKSGRNAVRNPDGFKDVDIALREDDRMLNDLMRNLSYYQRADVEKIDHEIESIRAEVIEQLFPPGHPREKGKHAPPPAAAPQEAP